MTRPKKFSGAISRYRYLFEQCYVVLHLAVIDPL